MKVPALKQAIVFPRSPNSQVKPFRVPTGSKFVNPLVYRHVIVPDTTMTVSDLDMGTVKVKHGFPMDIFVVVQYQVVLNENCHFEIYEEYSRMEEKDISGRVRKALDRISREVFMKETVIALDQGRTEVAKKIIERSNKALGQKGLGIVSYTIRDLSDTKGYLRSLGGLRTWEIRRNTLISILEEGRGTGAWKRPESDYLADLEQVDADVIEDRRTLIDIAGKYNIPFVELIPEYAVENWNEVEEMEKDRLMN